MTSKQNEMIDKENNKIPCLSKKGSIEEPVYKKTVLG